MKREDLKAKVQYSNPKSLNPSSSPDPKLNIHHSSLITHHFPAALILLAFVVLAVIYSLVTPPLEAGDESRHYAVVKYMADTGRLPVQEPGEAQIHWSHEGNQPPLYYALAAGLTFWIETGDWADVFWYNPHTTIGNPLRPDNKNITIHLPGESWPWRGHVLAVHLIRFFSITLAALTVIAGYAIALSLFKGNRWLAAGAMAITAFNPMFIFISASVNNDNLVITLVTVTLWFTVRMSESANQRISESVNQRGDESVSQSDDEAAKQRGSEAGHGRTAKPTLPFTIHHSSFIIHHSPFLLGLLIGLGALSKLYAVGLLPLAGLLLCWLAYQANRHPATGMPQRVDTLSPEGVPTSHHPSSVSTNGEGSSTHHVSRITYHVSRFTFHALIWNLTMLAVVIAVAGWFYLRNTILYEGDVLALQVMRDTAGQRDHAPSLATLWTEFEGFRIAYWALFGGVNILAHNWVYRLLDGISLLAALGVTAFIVLGFGFWVSGFGFHAPRFTLHALRFTLHASRLSFPTFIILLAWYLVMLAGFIAWNLTQPAGQGRLLYPAIAAISALGMLGLTWWLPERGQKLVAGLCILGLFILAMLAPFLYIAPAYAKPAILTEADLPADLQPLNFTYDGTMRLIGYQLHTPMVHPAENLSLTLYWQLLQPVELNYSIFIHLLGRQRQVIGQVDTYPGGGHWPTTLLPPGAILADHYQVPIAPEAEFNHAPTRLLIAAGIYDWREPGRPGRPAMNAAGQPVEPLITSAKLVPWQWPHPARLAAPINFFDRVTLLSYEVATDQPAVTLNWQANKQVETNYTVFIQAWLVGSRPGQDEYAEGFDGPPVQGDYPTSLWAPGEIIVDTHPLDLARLPSGDYYLLAGLYDPATGERLPAFGPAGPLSDYAVNLGTIKVGSKE